MCTCQSRHQGDHSRAVTRPGVLQREESVVAGRKYDRKRVEFRTGRGAKSAAKDSRHPWLQESARGAKVKCTCGLVTRVLTLERAKRVELRHLAHPARVKASPNGKAWTARCGCGWSETYGAKPPAERAAKRHTTDVSSNDGSRSEADKEVARIARELAATNRAAKQDTIRQEPIKQASKRRPSRKATKQEATKEKASKPRGER